MDLPDLLAAVQPGALQLQYCAADPELAAADAAAASRSVHAAYAAGGLGSLCETVEVSAGQVSIPDAADFFRRSFKTTDPPTALIPPARIYLDVASRRAILDSVDAALASGMLTLSREVQRFERLASRGSADPLSQ